MLRSVRTGEQRLMAWLGRYRGVVQATVDGLAWAIALVFATLLRYDFEVGYAELSGLLTLIPVAVVVQSLAGLVFGTYTGRSRFGSFDEVTTLVKAVAITAIFLIGFSPLFDPRLVPLSVPFIAGPTALVEMAGLRYCWRLGRERRKRPSADGCRRLLVFGAGDGAGQVIPALLRDPEGTYLPVALIDDDPAKRNLRIMGIRVLGDRSRLVEVAAATDADSLLIAIPSADADLVTEVERARPTGRPRSQGPPARPRPLRGPGRGRRHPGRHHC